MNERKRQGKKGEGKKKKKTTHVNIKAQRRLTEQHERVYHLQDRLVQCWLEIGLTCTQKTTRSKQISLIAYSKRRNTKAIILGPSTIHCTRSYNYREKPELPFCQKCRWQVTAKHTTAAAILPKVQVTVKHTYTLHMSRRKK